MVKIVKKVETLLFRFLLPPHRKIRHQKNFSSPYFEEEFSLTPFNAIWKTQKINKKLSNTLRLNFCYVKVICFFYLCFYVIKNLKKKPKYVL